MRRIGRAFLVFTCCLLAMPTCVYLLDGFSADTLFDAILMGALLGIAHVLVRPVLKIVSAPIGCLTLGLIQPVIDVGLIYACAYVVEGFRVTNILHALLAVILINSVCAIAGYTRH